MGVFKNLLGTVMDRFQLGLTGPLIKNDSGQISARNARLQPRARNASPGSTRPS